MTKAAAHTLGVIDAHQSYTIGELMASRGGDSMAKQRRQFTVRGTLSPAAHDAILDALLRIVNQINSDDLAGPERRRSLSPPPQARPRRRAVSRAKFIT